MKVIQESHSQMTLRLRPWFLWVFGAIFTSAGLSVALLGSQVHTFACRRDATAPATCQLSTKGLFWSNQRVLPINEIQGTTINSFRDSKGKYSYRLILLTNTGEVSPIPTNISHQETVKDWVKDIELFLKDTQQQTLLIEDDNRIFVFLFGGLFAVVGLAVAVLMGKVVVCNIDKTLGQLTLANYGLLGNSQTEYRTRDIHGVTVQKSVSSKGGKTYRVALVMNSGEYIPFTAYYSSGFRQHQQTADHISQFLNLKSIEEQHQSPSMQEVFSAVKDVIGLAFTGKAEDNLEKLQQAVVNNPEDAEANYQYGFTLYFLQRYQEAKPVLEKAKRLFIMNEKVQKVQQIDSLLQSLNQKL
ncbi:tetratricopeptide repeat protein [Nostoc sp. CCY0012]|uniref:tetratricopeptide repeat protein n=1 Tax=Nostoc sp. CCY0012 TaxID=1056123 RepID=UPI0039C757DF